MDFSSSSIFGVLSQRLQGKKPLPTATIASLGPSQPQPRHRHRNPLSRDRRRPMILSYSSSPGSSTLQASEDDFLATPATGKRPVRAQTFDDEDAFDVDSAMANFSASMAPKRDSNRSRTRGPSMALSRVSATLSRASERLEGSGEAGSDRRAARKSAKYDVAWREDHASACCRVCFALFTTLSRRRHHCRICGELVCGACSQDQIALTDKFAVPRRACMACCELLQAMKRAGDQRVKVLTASEAPEASTRRQSRNRGFSSAVAPPPAPPACHTPTNTSIPTISTPRFRDRLAEVHRVMAAGKLSRRRGSAEKQLFVISSRWLRQWLAFTSSASTERSNRGFDFDFDAQVVENGSTSTPTAISDAPGIIDNMSLLELSRGQLIRRAGLKRDDMATEDAMASLGDSDADYQLLSPEVWEVFQRLYGGGPAIHVNLTATDPSAWIVDIAGLLTIGTTAKVTPAVERALVTRHYSEDTQPSTGYGGRTPTATSASASGSDPAGLMAMEASKPPPKSPAWTASSSSSSSSLSEDKASPTALKQSAKVELLTVSVAKAEDKTLPEDEELGLRATVTNMRSPTAATAASAFAVAMKQARLNAQKALDDRASRVGSAYSRHSLVDFSLDCEVMPSFGGRGRKLPASVKAGEEERSTGALRQETRRRAALYDLSSVSGRRLPSVALQAADTRVRRDLLRLTKQQEPGDLNSYEAEQSDCKHREHLGFRPPLDHIQSLRDLHTTVARDSRGGKAEGEREWRLGYQNRVDFDTFEPKDGVRERVSTLSSSTTIAYPVTEASRSSKLEIWREEAPEQVETANQQSFNGSKHEKKVWCPASPTSFGTKSTAMTRPDRLQQFPVRALESFKRLNEPPDVVVVNARCAERQRNLLAQVIDTYSRVRARVDRLKDPTKRYALPIEAAKQHPRAYRLGLEFVPSNAQVSSSKYPQLRPKSAGTSLGFQIGQHGVKTTDLLSSAPQDRISKVAGAKRRPQSASIAYLRSATVYCVGVELEPQQISASSDYRHVLESERHKRQTERVQTLHLLAKRGLLHVIPLAQVFARLRREALHQVSRRLQHSVLEKLTLDEYMSACGCLNDVLAEAPELSEPSGAWESLENPRFRRLKDDAGISTSQQAMRKALVVSRQQFHLALEAFSLSSADVNLLFSALDVAVNDGVPLYDALETIEKLQLEHSMLRRARVQQLQAPSKDLELFRRLSQS
ncbi:hypothetical protein BBJ28_00012463 [Nothophytophthora sp. Chile5]|nr:hypothetical protein BBJ28_00012463 [Nothophytophthora sp. Chile5]